MQRAALIVQIEQTVMMVSIECPVMDSDMFMVVGCYRHRLVDVERVVPKQRQHAERLRSDKQRQQRCANAPNSSEKSHGVQAAIPPGPHHTRERPAELRPGCHSPKM